MSAIRKSTTTTTASKKPHCKVCQDAGKSEKEYTSHYVRSMPDRTGKTVITCPTLLATECRFCFEVGHTTKFCPVIAKNKKEEARRNYKEANKMAEEEKNKPKTIAAKKLTRFSALDMGSSEDEDYQANNTKLIAKAKTQTQTQNIQQEQKEEFPALLSSKAAPTSTVAAPMTTTTGWASIAAKTPEQYENEKYEQELLERSIKRQNPTPAPVKKVVFTAPTQKKSWADYSSDEEEEAAFEEAYQQVVKEKMMKQQQYCDEDW
jgi:hypothetical protein